jgi:hypothetical protein
LLLVLLLVPWLLLLQPLHLAPESGWLHTWRGRRHAPTCCTTWSIVLLLLLLIHLPC